MHGEACGNIKNADAVHFIMLMPKRKVFADSSFSIGKVHDILATEAVNWDVPVVELIELQTNDPFKVLVTTVLSARTKDKTTHDAAQRLFVKVRKAADLERLGAPDIAKIIYPVGFYKTKAKHLAMLPGALRSHFGGKIPHTVEELIELPGVGRKTANLVVAVAFGKPAICVDVHVHQICNRMGYIRTTTPLETEMLLRKVMPVKYWMSLNTILVAFGQHTCTSVSPHCSKCPVKRYCERVGVKTSR
jgi:endonuclease III